MRWNVEFCTSVACIKRLTSCYLSICWASCFMWNLLYCDAGQVSMWFGSCPRKLAWRPDCTVYFTYCTVLSCMAGWQYEVRQLSKEVGMDAGLRTIAFGVDDDNHLTEMWQAITDCRECGAWLVLTNIHLATPCSNLLHLLQVNHGRF